MSDLRCASNAGAPSVLFQTMRQYRSGPVVFGNLCGRRRRAAGRCERGRGVGDRSPTQEARASGGTAPWLTMSTAGRKAQSLPLRSTITVNCPFMPCFPSQMNSVYRLPRATANAFRLCFDDGLAGRFPIAHATPRVSAAATKPRLASIPADVRSQWRICPFFVRFALAARVSAARSTNATRNPEQLGGCF